MIRVGFTLNNAEWTGGVIYFLNLLRALHALPEPRIEPVVFVPRDTPDELLDQLPPIEVVKSNIVDNKFKLNYARKALRVALRRDYVLEHFFRWHGIDVLSHSRHLGSRAHLPTIQWITDFQHRRMPGFFPSKELAQRNALFHFHCRFASQIILSSYDAQNDLAQFDPNAVAKSRVLHFVAGTGTGQKLAVSHEQLRRRYGFDGPYFYLPNQFWVHKNHGLVVDALALLKARGRRVSVLATGHTKDRRQPGYFEELMKKVTEVGVNEEFRVLGLVPYGDVAALMHHSIAVINPSLFEGWSTTVEEAKSMGKSVLLSDIPVHREQEPRWGTFFKPNNPAELADAIERTSQTYSSEIDAQRIVEAQRELPARVRKFGQAYEDIVLECLTNRQKGELGGIQNAARRER